MWEWSKRNRKSTPPTPAKTLLSAYNDLLLQSSASGMTTVKAVDIASPERITATAEVISSQEMLFQLQQKLQTSGLKNLILREFAYEPQTWAEMHNCFEEYVRAREIFLKLLGYSYGKECLEAGLTKNDLLLLRQSYAPENYNTHLKIPFDFGGTLDFENFALVPTHPVHGVIHRLIDYQIENNYLRHHQKIFLPWFEGKIYHD